MPYGEESPLSAHVEEDKTIRFIAVTTTTTTTTSSVVQRGAGDLQEDAHHIGGAGGRSFLQQDFHNVEMTHK